MEPKRNEPALDNEGTAIGVMVIAYLKQPHQLNLETKSCLVIWFNLPIQS